MNIEEVSRYASGLGVELYTEYKSRDAAKLIRIGVNALNSAANRDELPCIKTGVRNRVYLGVDLIRWKLSKRTQSESITLQKTGKENGAGLGMTNLVSSENLLACAQKALTPQNQR
ncbi:MAG: hypothetical protein KTR20_12685 [Cellvibrionaceae bacterium]|nr:hypothetical protein [Cellvibrionaceae bacterium]